MARLPVLSGAEAVRILHKDGWTVDRQRAPWRTSPNGAL
jgi:predicted RNA binding protein YcfA (HicA-like mRNA interferase family)